MRQLTILIAILSVLSCGSESIDEPPGDYVTVIFDHAPEHARLVFEDGSWEAQYSPLTNSRSKTFTYTDRDYRIMQYSPGPESYDTLVIPAFNGVAEVAHLYKVYGEERYLLIGGDTILFTYDKMGYPTVSSRTSRDYTDLYNLPFAHPSYRTSTGFSTRDALSPRFNMIRRVLDPGQNAPKSLRDKYKAFNMDFAQLESLNREQMDWLAGTLDSLRRAGTIDERFINYYHYTYLTEPDINSLNFSDSLMFMSGYQSLVARRITRDMYAKASLKGQQGLSANALAGVFDSVASCRLPEKTKALALRLVLDKICETNDARTELEYTETYVALTGDSARARSLEANRRALTNTGDMELVGITGDTITFGKLMEQYKGKVVYLDLWASWCAPCRAEMPAAMELRKLYEGKNVVFLYLAKDDKYNDWLKAVGQCGTDVSGGVNYFITNSKAAEFLKANKVTSIPRYMVFDTEGKLVDGDAPRPSDSAAIEAKLDHYLPVIRH